MVELKIIDGKQYYISNSMSVSFSSKEWSNAKARYAKQLAKKAREQSQS